MNDASVDELSLQVSQLDQFELDDFCIPTGKIVENNQFVSSKKLAGVNLDDCYKIANYSSKTVSSKISDGNAVLEVWQEIGEGKMNYLQLKHNFK